MGNYVPERILFQKFCVFRLQFHDLNDSVGFLYFIRNNIINAFYLYILSGS